MVVPLLLIFLAGAMNAAFPLPMRYMKQWAFENIWTMFSLVALLAGPWALALAGVPRLAEVYAQAGWQVGATTALLGMLWGVSAFLFGLSVEMVGMSLTFAVVNGVSSAVGSWAPLVVLHPGKLFTAAGMTLSAGLLIVIAGVAICARAGSLRAQSAPPAAGPPRASYLRGLVVCVSCALLAPCMNLGFSFGQPIAATAVRLGASPRASTNAVLAVLMAGGFLVNGVYCLVRLTRRRTFALFAAPGSGWHYALGVLMGSLWIVSYSVYGSATTWLGSYGTVIGWPILMATITIGSGALDAAYGDWQGRPLRIMALGILALIAAVGIISFALDRLNQGA